MADVDGDGRLDFAVANQWAASSFYRNESRDRGSFLGLHLLLPVDRRAARADSIPAGPPRRGLRGPARPRRDRERSSCPTAGGSSLPGRRRQRPFGQAEPRPALRAGPSSPRDATPGRACTGAIRAGRVQRETLELAPGWHTVLLGGPTGGCGLNDDELQRIPWTGRSDRLPALRRFAVAITS